jgi:aryl-alcohol dehydrogenase-like predicted oxidoreductase
MKQRTLGRTGLRISEIGFGCGGNAGLMVRGTPGERRSAIARALELGITYFDTAPVYGDTLSETHLGQALRELGARPTVVTKVALEINELDDIPAAVERSVERSLARLGLDAVAVVYLHNRVGSARAPKPDTGVGALLTVDDIIGENSVRTGFERLRQRGLARYFGCCSFGGEMPLVDELLESDFFDSMLVNYSLLNQTAFDPARKGGGLDYAGVGAHAARRGMGTAILRVLEGGALVYDEKHPLAGGGVNPEYDRNAQRARALDELREPGERNLVPTGLRFALANPGVSVVLVGFSETRQVDEAVAAAAKGPLSAQALQRAGDLLTAK